MRPRDLGDHLFGGRVESREPIAIIDIAPIAIDQQLGAG